MYDENKLQAFESQLELMWDKIQELKQTDSFAAQILYEKYRKLLSELPPPLPKELIDQAASQ